jgi:amidase
MKEYTLTELRQGLDEGLFTSVELCELYLKQIKRLNPQLNAVAELNIEWRQIAEQMDLELKLSGPRSPLHGIPIALKDNINTADKLHTTAGSLALADLYADSDAFLVGKLRQAGAIILGKANMSEFAYFMSYDGMPSGYSSRKGQVKNPYGELDPLGSSTGSAVMAAANMIPVAVGTETNGSLIAPATNNSLCSIKPTRGLVSRSGIIPITSTQDTAGPLGRTVKDIAILLDQLWGRDPQDAATLSNPYLDYKFADACDRDVSGLKIGALAFSNRPYSEADEMRLNDAKATLKQLDVEVVDVVLEAKSMKNDVTLVYEFKPDFNRYLASVKGCTKMTSLADIIAFNKADPERCLKYGQSILEASEKTSGTLTEPEYWEARLLASQIANEINTLIDTENLDAVLLPYRTSHAPIAGNPCITVPAKSLIDLVPGNVVFIGRKWDDETLFAIASSYERSTNYRVPPVLPQE